MADYKPERGIASGKTLTDEAVVYLSHIASRGIGLALMSDEKGWLSDSDLARRIMRGAGFTDEEINRLSRRYCGYDPQPYCH